jgi:hypothetical protein
MSIPSTSTEQKQNDRVREIYISKYPNDDLRGNTVREQLVQTSADLHHAART